MMKYMKFVAAAACAAVVFSASVHGASLTFDANTASNGAQDGSGVWTNGLPATNWWNGAAHTNWNSATPDSAIFGAASGAAGTVSVVDTQTVAGITFNPAGSGTYVLTNGQLALSGTPLFQMNTNAMIATTLAGGATLVVQGPGTLTLNGSNLLSGTLRPTNGTLTLGGQANLLAGVSLAGSVMGTLNVLPGAALRVNSFLMLGDTGGSNNGTMNQSGGLVDYQGVTNNFRIAHWPTETSTYNLSGGTLLALTNRVMFVGWDGTAIFNQSGGTSQLYGIQVGGGDTGIKTAAAFYNLTGGRIEIGAGSLRARTNAAVVNLGGGTVAASASWTSAVPLRLSGTNGNTTLETPAGLTMAFSAVLSGVGGINKAGAGALVLSSAGNSFTGNVTVAEGRVVAAVGNNNPAPGSTALGIVLGAGGRVFRVETNAALHFAANDVLGNALASPTPTLAVVGGVVTMTNNFVTLGPVVLNGGTLTGFGGVNAGYQQYSFSGPITVTGATASSIGTQGGANNGDHLGSNTIFNVADVTGDATADLVVSAALVNQNQSLANAAGGLTKTGAGTMQLDGINLLTGTASVNGGTLALGAAGSLSSAKVIVGTGGVFDVTAIASYTVPASQTIQGNGVVTGQTIVAGDGSGIHPGAAGVAGTLTFNVGTLLGNGGGFTNAFDLTNNVAIGGGNDLLVVNGGFEPNGSVLRINPLVPLVSGTYRLINYSGSKSTTFASLFGNTTRDAWTLDDLAGTASNVNLTVSAGTNQSLVWSAQVSADWDILTSLNWTNPVAGVAEVYGDLDSVLFNDTGATSSIVNLTTVVKPTAVTVNSTSNYTFTGAGRISNYGAGLATLTKDGSGTLTVATTNDFTGGTVVSNGTVVAAASGAFGTGPIVLAAGTTLEGSTATLLGNVVSGAGRLVKSGGGSLTLTGTNTYTGTTIISNGALVVSGLGSLGGGNYAANITNGGTLTINGATQTLSGTISGTGSVTMIGGAGSGSLTLSKTNSFTGATVLLAGALKLASTNGPALVGPVIFDNNASPDIYTTVDNQFGPGVVLLFTNNVGDHGRLELIGTTQTLAGVHNDYTAQRGVVQNREFGPVGGGTSLLILNGSGDYSFGGYLRNQTGVLGLSKTGTGTQTVYGSQINYTGPTLVSGGLYKLSNTTAFASAITNSATVEFNAPVGFNLNNGVHLSGTGTWNKTGVAAVTLNGTAPANLITASGQINIQQGILQNGGNVVNWSGNTANMDISAGATLDVLADPVFVNALTGAGAVSNSWGNATGQSGLSSNTERFVIGVAGGSSTFNGRITDTHINGANAAKGLMELVKAGTGTITLAGVNDYSGVTIVSNGVLALGATGAISNSPRIVVATSGSTLDLSIFGNYGLVNFQSLEGFGLVTGSVATATGSKLTPGTAGTAGTLTFGNNLNLTAATTNYFNLSSSTTIGSGINDLINVGGLLEPSNAVIVINAAAPLATGSYRLFNYTGTKASSFSTTVITNPTRNAWTLNEATPGEINLVVSGGAYSLKWNAQTSANWDTNVGTNWLNIAGATNTTFIEGDSVLFDDSGAITNGIALVGTLKPASVMVNSASNYSLGGLGKISGAIVLTKDGAGTLTVTTTNDYSGGTVISNGTLQIGNGTINGGFGSGIYSVAAPATLRMFSLTANGNRPVWSNIVGSGTLALRSVGVGTANGDWAVAGLTNGFMGTLKIESGRVYTTGLGNQGLGNASDVIVQAGGHLGFWVGGSLPQNVSIAGTGYGEAGYEAAIRFANAGLVTVLNGALTVASNATIGASGTGIVAGVISGSSTARLSVGTSSLAGLMVFTNDNTYAGGTTIQNGSTLSVPTIADVSPSAIGTTGTLVFNNGTLRYTGADANTARAITNTGAATWDVTNTAATLTLSGPMAGTGLITKIGAGNMVWSNNTTQITGGGLRVNRGTLIIANATVTNANNAADYVATGAGESATMILQGTSVYYRINSFVLGENASSKGVMLIQDNARLVSQGGGYIFVGNGGTGVLHMTGGSISHNSGNAFFIGNYNASVGAMYQTGGSVYDSTEFDIAYQGGGAPYGFYLMTGGSLTNNSWIHVGRGGSGAGLLYQSGGSINATNAGFGFVVGNNSGGGNSIGVMYFSGGIATGNRMGIGWAGTCRGEATIAGGATVNIGATGVFLNQAGSTFGVLNLNGGTLLAPKIFNNVAGGTNIVNFNGGLWQVTAAGTVMGAGAGGAGAVSAAYVYGGGAIIDSSNLSITVTQPLLAPNGNGVSSISLTGNVPGYVGAPYVQMTGGGGTGATAVALFDYVSGSVTGVVVTSPGVGYSSAPTVTFTFAGKASDSNSAVAAIGANSSGGLSKLGSGSLSLNSSNTYSGATIISAGSMFGTGSVNSAVSVLNGAAIGPSASTTVTGTFTVASLTITNGGLVSAHLRGTNPSIRVTGNFNVSPTSLVQVIGVGAVTNGTYVLVDYDGAFNGNSSDLYLAAIPSGSQGYLTNNLANTSLDLVVTNVGTGIKWNGLVDATWKDLGPLNWTAIPGGFATAYSSLDAVLFDDTAAANYSVNLTALVSPSFVTVSNDLNAYAFSGSGGLVGATPLIKSGTNSLTITTANNYTGPTTIRAGTLTIGGSGVLGGGTYAGAITNNGAFIFASSASQTNSGVMSGSGTLLKTNTSVLALTAVNTVTGAITCAGGTLRLGTGGNNANWYPGKPTITVNGGGILTFSGYNVFGNTLAGMSPVTLNPGATMLASGTGGNIVTVLNDLTLNGATVSVNCNDGFGATWGTFGFGGITTATSNSAINVISGNGTIANGNNFSPVFTVNTPAPTDSLLVTPVIQSSGGTALSVVKRGSGTLTFTATNTYAGDTTIQGGTLALSGGGSITGTPRIILSTGATFDVSSIGTFALRNFQSLEGSGLVTGNVATATGAKIIPGTAGAVGTLTFTNNLNMTATTTNYFDLTSDTTIGSNDMVIVGGLLEPSNAVIVINTLSPLATGTYRLFTYTGTKTTSFNTNVLGNVTRKTWTLDETTPGQVNLVVSGSYFDLVWNSQTSTNWDINIGTNWLDIVGATNTTFFETDSVLFDDTGALTNSINLAGSLKPSRITVNSSSNYSITGAGKISSFTGLTKDGTGTLTLGGTANDFIGTVIISNGVLKAATVSALGTTNGTTTVLANGALDVNFLNLGQEVVQIIGAGFGGNGTIVNSGAQQLNALQYVRLLGDATIGGANRWDIRAGTAPYLDLNGYTLTKVGTNFVGLVGTVTTNAGDIIINAGQFGLHTTPTVMSGPGSIYVNPAGALDIYDSPTVTKTIVLNGGALSVSLAGTIGPLVVINTNSVINTVGGNLTLTNTISGPSGFTKTNANTLVLTGSNTYEGITTIAAGGTLQIGTNSAGGNLGTNAVVINGALTFLRSDTLQVASPISGIGTLTQASTGTVVLSGPAALTGGVFQTARGFLVFNGNTFNSTVGTNARSISLQAGATFVMTNNPTLNLAGTIALGTAAPGQSGHIVQYDGTLVVNGSEPPGAYRALQIGEYPNGTNSYTMYGGSLWVTNGLLYLPWNATQGIWNIYGGTAVVRQIQINSGSSGNGMLNFERGSLIIGPGGIQRATGSSTFNIGGVTIGAYTNWASNVGMTLTGTNGATTFDTAGSIIQLTGVHSGTGGLTKTGGGTLVLAAYNTFTNDVIVNAGTLVLSNTVNSGASVIGGSKLTINPGATVITYVNSFGYAAGNGPRNSVVISGGTLSQGNTDSHLRDVTMTAGTISGTEYRPHWDITVNASAGTSAINSTLLLISNITFAVANGAAARDLIVSGALNGGNGFNKTGTGLMALESISAYTGPTIISNGTLLVNGSISTGLVTVLPGATLGGTGTINGSVTSGGTVSPGTSPGILTLNAPYVQTASGTLHIEIGGLTAGTDHDQLNLNGATLGGTLTVTLTNAFTPAFADAFVILSDASSTLATTFTTTNLPALGGGLAWDLQYFPNAILLSIVTNAAPPPTGYNAFSNLYVLTQGPEGDDDLDGYANLLEYVTGANPTNADTLARMNATRTNTLLALRFTRDTNTIDATLIVEGANSATNNATWTGIATNLAGSWGGATNVVEGAGSPAAVTAYDTAPSTNRFLRLRVTRP